MPRWLPSAPWCQTPLSEQPISGTLLKQLPILPSAHASLLLYSFVLFSSRLPLKPGWGGGGVHTH